MRRIPLRWDTFLMQTWNEKYLTQVKRLTYSHDNNILELYNILLQTRLTTSKTKRDI